MGMTFHMPIILMPPPSFITDCNRKIISGGAEGQIRVWSINFSNKNKPTVSLLETMKEHKCKITAIKIRKNMQQCATASEDGTCIIWDLERFTRNQMVMANSLFQCLVWNLEENQIVTSEQTERFAIGRRLMVPLSDRWMVACQAL